MTIINFSKFNLNQLLKIKEELNKEIKFTTEYENFINGMSFKMKLKLIWRWLF